MPKDVTKKLKTEQQPDPLASQRDEAGAEALSKKIPVKYCKTPIKSDMDPKQYRGIKLPNGFIALLASLPEDPDSEEDLFQDDTDEESEFLEALQAEQSKSLVESSLCIDVGHFSDPEQVPEIAELLSSLIPRYSKKYPLPEDRFGLTVEWLDIECNAETTVFTFGVDKSQLPQSLDRFAQHFIAPLIKREDLAEAIKRKLSCHKARREHNISKRVKEQMFVNLCSTKHPIKSLGIDYIKGLESISEDEVYRELLKFRERHYSANRMTFYIQAKMPLDDLEEIVKEYFSAIPYNKLQPCDYIEYSFRNSFDPAKFCKIYITEKLAHRDEAIELTWVLPPSRRRYRSKTHEYMVWVLNHSGSGSLSRYLQKRKWCNRLSCQINRSDFGDNSMYTLLELTLNLTNKGFQEYQCVIHSVYSYISRILIAGPQQHLSDEIRIINECKFRFEYGGNRGDGLDYGYAAETSKDMIWFRTEDYLSGRFLCYEFDPHYIILCTILLAPKRANIIVYTENYQPQLFLKTFVPETEYYSSRKVPEDWIRNWENALLTPGLEFPAGNIFRSDDFGLITIPENPPLYPVKIDSSASSEIWYKPNDRFQLPICVMCFLYVSPLPLMSSENAAMLDLFVTVLEHVLAYDIEQAKEAKYHCRISTRENGLEVTIDGLSQKVPLLMQTITTAMVCCCERLTESLFHILREKQFYKYQYILNRPKRLINDLKLSTVKLIHWSAIEKCDELPAFTLDKFKTFHEQFAKRVYIKGLVQGNMTQADVLESVRKFSEILKYGPLPTHDMPERRYEIPKGERCIRIQRFSCPYSRVANYYQFPKASIELSVTIELLNVILTNGWFDMLITKRLEYNTEFEKNILGALDYTAVVPYVSKETTTMRLDASIEKTRKIIDLVSKELTDREWMTIKKMAAKIMYKPHHHLWPEASFNWEEIVSGKYVFDRRVQEAHVLRGLKVEDLRKYVSIVTSYGPEMRKLSFQVVPNIDGTPDDLDNDDEDSEILEYLPEEEAEDYFIMDIDDYQRRLRILPITS